jgi:membrane-bound ClpP family serine protease
MTALGVSLLVIGAIVVLIEAHVPSLGMLGGPGVIALGAGAVLAVSGLGGGIALGIISALLVVAVGMAVLAVSLRKGMSVRRRRIASGAEGIVGHIGVVRSWNAVGGTVQVDGALWRARVGWGSGDEDEVDLHEGDHVVVEHLTGLTLRVRPAEEWELAP